MDIKIERSKLKEQNQTAIKIVPYIIVLSTSLVLAASNIFMPSLIQLANSFNCSTNDLLISVSAYYIAFAISGLACGVVADRYGYRKTILLGFYVFLMGSCLCLIAINAKMFILGNLLEGIGASAPLIVGLATIQHLYHAEKSVKILGWMGALLSIMPSLSPIIGGYLALEGWRTIYIFILITALILLSIMHVFHPESRTNFPQEKKGVSDIFLTYFSIIKQKGFLYYASIYPVLVLGSTAFLTILPLYALKNLHYDPKSCGYLIGAISSGYALGGFSTAKLVSKYGVDLTLRFGIYLTFVGSIILISSLTILNSNLILFMAGFIFQYGLAITHPPSITRALEFFSDKKASASAIRGTFSIIGSASGATIAATLSDAHLLYVVFITFASSIFAFFTLNGIKKLNSHRLILESSNEHY